MLLKISATMNRSTPSARLSNSVHGLFEALEQTGEAVPPFILLNDLRNVAPQFAETDRSGNLAQQGEQ